MVNFGHLNTVPEKYQNRLIFSWAPDVTLMRTDPGENQKLGQEIAEKLNNARGPVKVLLPMEGISKVSSSGGVFYAPDTDHILFETIKQQVSPNIAVIEVQANINHPQFAEQAVNHLLELIKP
jgi:uncharacterized protein (UPF0261 family)